MRVLLEDFQTLDSSIRWEIQRAYYAARGTEAWTGGTIPYRATNNMTMLTQHARILIQLVEELVAAGCYTETEPVYLLELGGGLGMSPFYLFEALNHRTGEAGRRLAKRLRYVLSDYTREGLAMAVTQPQLQPLVESGNLIPAFLDLADPSRIENLDGTALEFTATAVISSYVCDSTPMKILRKQGGSFYDKSIQTWAETDAEEPGSLLLEKLLSQPDLLDLGRDIGFIEKYMPVELAEILPSERHVQTAERVCEDYDVATFAYPFVYLEALSCLAEKMHSGGMFLTNDVGTSRRERLKGHHSCEPRQYGNATYQTINFAILECFAEAGGWSCERTSFPHLSVHSIVMRTGGRESRAFSDLFREVYDEERSNSDFMDYRHAGSRAFRAGDYRRAIRNYERCRRLSPLDADILYRLARAYRRSRFFAEAIEAARAGLEVNAWESLNFHYEIGRSQEKLGDYSAAISSYEKSMDQFPDARTRKRIGAMEEKIVTPLA